MLAYISANKLIKAVIPGAIRRYQDVSGDQPSQKYPEIYGPSMVICIFTMTVYGPNILSAKSEAFPIPIIVPIVFNCACL